MAARATATPSRAALCLLLLALVLPAPAAAGTRAEAFGSGGAAGQAGGEDGDGCAPALALGGVGVAAGAQLRLTGNQANFGFHERTIGSDAPGTDFLNQRLRAWVNVHDRESCRYGAYVQVQAGHVELGSGRELLQRRRRHVRGDGGRVVALRLKVGRSPKRSSQGSTLASLLALEVGGSVLLTGDFFRAAPAGPAPAALYELYSRWQLEF